MQNMSETLRIPTKRNFHPTLIVDIAWVVYPSKHFNIPLLGCSVLQHEENTQMVIYSILGYQCPLWQTVLVISPLLGKYWGQQKYHNFSKDAQWPNNKNSIFLWKDSKIIYSFASLFPRVSSCCQDVWPTFDNLRISLEVDTKNWKINGAVTDK